jgi:hypothetical protein
MDDVCGEPGDRHRAGHADRPAVRHRRPDHGYGVRAAGRQHRRQRRADGRSTAPNTSHAAAHVAAARDDGATHHDRSAANLARVASGRWAANLGPGAATSAAGDGFAAGRVTANVTRGTANVTRGTADVTRGAADLTAGRGATRHADATTAGDSDHATRAADPGPADHDGTDDACTDNPGVAIPVASGGVVGGGGLLRLGRPGPCCGALAG